MGKAQDEPEPDLWPGMIAPTAGGRGGRNARLTGRNAVHGIRAGGSARASRPADQRRMAQAGQAANEGGTPWAAPPKGPRGPQGGMAAQAFRRAVGRRRRRDRRRLSGGRGWADQPSFRRRGTRPQDRMGRARRRGSGAPRRALRHTGKAERASRQVGPHGPPARRRRRETPTPTLQACAPGPAPAGGSTPHQGNSPPRIPSPLDVNQENTAGFLPIGPGQALPDAGIRRPGRRTGARRRRAVAPTPAGAQGKAKPLSGCDAPPKGPRGPQGGNAAHRKAARGGRQSAARTSAPLAETGGRISQGTGAAGPGRKTGWDAPAEGAPGPHGGY